MGELGVFDVTDPAYEVLSQGGGVDWRGTFQKTADAVRDAGGGVLFVPPGTYDIQPWPANPGESSYTVGEGLDARSGAVSPGPGAIKIHSNTWVRGSGRSSILRRLPVDYASSLLQVNGEDCVRFSDLAFDLQLIMVLLPVLDANRNQLRDEQGDLLFVWQPVNYVAALGVGEGFDVIFDTVGKATEVSNGRQSRDIVIERCSFFNSGARPFEHWTEHAILARDVRSLIVKDNDVDGLQIKLAVGRDSGVVVHGNRIRDAFNCGVSVVLQDLGAGVEPSISDIVITDNTVDDSSDACIYIGLDPPDPDLDPQPLPSGSYTRVIVAGNTLRRPRVNSALLMRMPLSASDWLIERNLLEGDPSLDGVSRPFGITVSEHWADSRLLRLSITNNVVRGFNQAGIAIRGNCGMAVVRGNSLQAVSGSGLPETGRVTDLIVTNNSAHSCIVYGFHVVAWDAEIGPVLFHGNVATDTWGAIGSERPGLWIDSKGTGRAEVSLRRNVLTDTRPEAVDKTQRWGVVLYSVGGGKFAVEDGGDNDLSGNAAGPWVEYVIAG